LLLVNTSIIPYPVFPANSPACKSYALALRAGQLFSDARSEPPYFCFMSKQISFCLWHWSCKIRKFK